MEPVATFFLVGRDPPPPTKTAHLAEGQGPAPSGWARRAFQQALILLLACALVWGLHRAGCNLGSAVMVTYGLAILCAFLWKLELLRRQHAVDPVAAARERRRVGHAAWAISLVMGSNVAVHAASAARSVPTRVALWVLAGLAMALGLYFLFAARCSDAGADDDGHWPEKDRHELSPEQRV